ncbi:unnamed protein product [Lactuca virosa]|uniref:Uncharacterized protein n=1 Tax=Lactuca virosa TaxID=75947 RepID=A0AAU9M695_9ASTR|nr:unnamed protein product [Lactuca virosa]
MRWMVSGVVVVKLMMIEHGYLQIQPPKINIVNFIPKFPLFLFLFQKQCVFPSVFVFMYMMFSTFMAPPHQEIQYPATKLFLLISSKGFDFRLLIF